MMQLARATDILLSFLTSIDRRRFLESVKGQADVLVITGDIAESNSLGEILRQMNAALPSGETVRLRCQHQPQFPLVAD